MQESIKKRSTINLRKEGTTIKKKREAKKTIMKGDRTKKKERKKELRIKRKGKSREWDRGDDEIIIERDP